MDLLSERRINYRELQSIAKKMNLPGNLKYNLLVEVIRARKEGKEHVVEKILGEQKLERVRRKHEKLGSQESAYQHLCMTSDRGLTIMPRSYHHNYAAASNTCINPPPNINVGGLCSNNGPMRYSHHSPISDKEAWSKCKPKESLLKGPLPQHLKVSENTEVNVSHVHNFEEDNSSSQKSNMTSNEDLNMKELCTYYESLSEIYSYLAKQILRKEIKKVENESDKSDYQENELEKLRKISGSVIKKMFSQSSISAAFKSSSPRFSLTSQSSEDSEKLSSCKAKGSLLSLPSSQPWAGVTNIYNTDVRTVLQMPGEVFHNLHKKASEECQHRIQEAHKRNPPMSYVEWLKLMEHKRNPSNNIYGLNQQNYTPEQVSNPRDITEYCVESEAISPSEDQKKSFQIKDILHDNGNQTGYGQIGFNTNQYDWSQLPSDFSSFVPENFIPQINSYLPSMNTPWKGAYESMPDSTYAQPQYIDYSIQQEVPSSSANAVSVSPQTSDTISATDEDLPKENSCDISGSSIPLHHSYISTQKQVQYLSQLDYEEPSTSNVPDLPSVDDEDQIIDPSLISTDKDELDNGDGSFIVLDPSDEFSPHQQ